MSAARFDGGRAFASVMAAPADRLDLTGGSLGGHAARPGTGRTLEVWTSREAPERPWGPLIAT
jgi:hypothetical protein